MKEPKPDNQIEADPLAGVKLLLEPWLRGLVRDELQKVLRDPQASLRPSSTLLTVQEFAKVLRVPSSWIYDRTRRNAIPHIKVSRYARFNPNEVLAWLESQKGARASPPFRVEKRVPRISVKETGIEETALQAGGR